jgi:hypothetical protein
MSKAQLLEDIFEVQEKDPDGKKFDKGAPPLDCIVQCCTPQ